MISGCGRASTASFLHGVLHAARRHGQARYTRWVQLSRCLIHSFTKEYTNVIRQAKSPTLICGRKCRPDLVVVCLPAALFVTFTQDGSLYVPHHAERVLEKYILELRSSVEITRMGHALALGGMPRFMLAGKLNVVLEGLIAASTIGEKDSKMADARRDAIKAIGR